MFNLLLKLMIFRCPPCIKQPLSQINFLIRKYIIKGFDHSHCVMLINIYKNIKIITRKTLNWDRLELKT